VATIAFLISLLYYWEWEADFWAPRNRCQFFAPLLYSIFNDSKNKQKSIDYDDDAVGSVDALRSGEKGRSFDHHRTS
jgi:hypothetical protein